MINNTFEKKIRTCFGNLFQDSQIGKERGCKVSTPFPNLCIDREFISESLIYKVFIEKR